MSDEAWKTSYSAKARTTDGTDYVVTKVATVEFQLYRHEAAHLHAILGKALARPTKKFSWGVPIETFELDLDGSTVTIVKYHPWKSSNGTVHVGDANMDEVLFHNAEISWSHRSIQESLVYWLTYKSLGLNNHSLAAGICRALDISKESA